MLDYRMFVQRTPYNYSEEAINSQNSKLVSYVRWLSKKHMYATCPRLRVQAVLFLTQTGRGRERVLVTSSDYDFSSKYETGSSWRIAIEKNLKQTNKKPTWGICVDRCEANYVLSQIVSSHQWPRVQETSEWMFPGSWPGSPHFPLSWRRSQSLITTSVACASGSVWAGKKVRPPVLGTRGRQCSERHHQTPSAFRGLTSHVTLHIPARHPSHTSSPKQPHETSATAHCPDETEEGREGGEENGDPMYETCASQTTSQFLGDVFNI